MLGSEHGNAGWFTEAMRGVKDQEWVVEKDKKKIKVVIHHPVNTVRVIRDHMADHLKVMARFTEGTLDPEHISEMIQTGRFVLLTLWIEGELAFCSVFEYVYYPKYESLRSVISSGARNHKFDWYGFALREAVYDWMAGNGIYHLEGCARKGFAKKLCEVFGAKRMHERIGVDIRGLLKNERTH